MIRHLAPLVVLALTSQASGTRAQDGARLEYARTVDARSCPDDAALRAIVVGRLGADPFDVNGRWVIRVLVDGNDHGFSAHVQLIDADGVLAGEREVASEGGRCEDLLEALSLTLSVVLDAVPQSDEPPTPEVVVVTVMPDSGLLLAHPPESRAPPTPTLVPAALSPDRPRWRIGAGPVLGRGELPRVDAAIELLIRMRMHAASAMLATTLSLPRDSDRLATGGYARLAMVRLTAAGCGHVSRLALCGLLALRAYLGSGHDVAVPTSDFQLGIGLGARIDVDLLRHAPFVWMARAEIVGAARRTDAVLDATRVWTEPTWSGSVGMLAALEFR